MTEHERNAIFFTRNNCSIRKESNEEYYKKRTRVFNAFAKVLANEHIGAMEAKEIARSFADDIDQKILLKTAGISNSDFATFLDKDQIYERQDETVDEPTNRLSKIEKRIKEANKLNLVAILMAACAIGIFLLKALSILL